MKSEDFLDFEKVKEFWSALTLEELWEIEEFAYEAIGETETQYKSEIALYGDAWPGAAIELSEAKRKYRNLRKVIDLRLAGPPKPVPESAPVFDDIPF